MTDKNRSKSLFDKALERAEFIQETAYLIYRIISEEKIMGATHCELFGRMRYSFGVKPKIIKAALHYLEISGAIVSKCYTNDDRIYREAPDFKGWRARWGDKALRMKGATIAVPREPDGEFIK